MFILMTFTTLSASLAMMMTLCLPHRRLPVLSGWGSQFTDASYFFLITLATCLAFSTGQPLNPIDRGKA